MLQYSLVTVRNAVMRLIYDDGVKVIFREPAQALLPHHALYGAYYDAEPAAKAGFLCLLSRASKPGCLCDLDRGLIQKFSSMRKDQYTVAIANAFFRYFCENICLSASGRQHEQSLLDSIPPFREDGILCLLLVMV